MGKEVNHKQRFFTVGLTTVTEKHYELGLHHPLLYSSPDSSFKLLIMIVYAGYDTLHEYFNKLLLHSHYFVK